MKLNLDGAKRHRKEILKAIKAVVDSEHYIRGPQFEAFNQEWAAACRVKRCVGLGNGTDALYLGLRAAGIGPGDEVISPAHNVAYTALAIHQTGATPIFADVDEETLTLDPDATEAAITPKTKAIIPVHLYGHMAAVEPLRELCDRKKLFMLEDAAQAHLAGFWGTRAGQWGHAAAFSFYPTKNLGAIGEAGALVTDDIKLADRVLRLSDAGRSERYTHTDCGINSGLDELQAAVLRVKLNMILPTNTLRRRVANRYNGLLKNLRLPAELPHYNHVYHLYVVRPENRSKLLQGLNEADVPTLIHYPLPVHLQPCFQHLNGKRGQFPIAEAAADSVLSLPCHPELTELDQLYVIDTVNDLTA